MISNTSQKAFISYSNADRSTAQKLAQHLTSNGIDTWFDNWEIKPGDSLVQKIFEEGLKNCRLFLILLSPASVKSNWVRHELDAAIVQRIAGATRVVPIIIEPCEIPVALRPLLRLDLHREGFANVVAQLADVWFDRNVKPPLGPKPPGLNIQIPGLSNAAARIATILAGSMDQPDGAPLAYSGETLKNQLDLTPQQINDAVDELEMNGLVRTMKWSGTNPFAFGQAEPTASLPFYLKKSSILSYDPEKDIRLVATAVVNLKSADGNALQHETNLPPGRLNRAVSYMEDYGLIQVLHYLGTAPFRFGEVIATSATRRFFSEE